MTTHRGLLSILIGFSIASPLAGDTTAYGQAQRTQSATQRPAVPVRGTVFDSLRGRPLANAFVTVGGVSGASATDAKGRFRFDSVPPGVYTVTAQHPVLDSIGLSGLAARATVEAGGREVQLAVPSFETLWRSSCAGRVPRDSGIVFGNVRHAKGGAPVANAGIELSWADLVLDRRRSVVQRQWRIETRTNAQGGYAVCGVPSRVGLVVRAANDSSASGQIDIPPNGIRVQRRDLMIGSATPGPFERGAIVGVVVDPQGQPVSGARVLSEGLAEVRTNADGRFRVNDVPAGTRQIEVLAIGVAPALAAADVTPGDSAIIDVHLQRVLTLDAVRTMAARGNRVFAAEFDARRRSGFGYSRDSSDIIRYPQFPNVLRDVPGLTVRQGASSLTITVSDGKGGSCEPEVLIDGAPAAFGHLVDLLPNEVGGLEVYARASRIPARFVPPGIQPQCGMILVWTKYGFRNR
jgi:protocatechuate 3,4-dioxygenase beta subunit